MSAPDHTQWHDAMLDQLGAGAVGAFDDRVALALKAVAVVGRELLDAGQQPGVALYGAAAMFINVIAGDAGLDRLNAVADDLYDLAKLSGRWEF